VEQGHLKSSPNGSSSATGLASVTNTCSTKNYYNFGTAIFQIFAFWGNPSACARGSEAPVSSDGLDTLPSLVHKLLGTASGLVGSVGLEILNLQSILFAICKNYLHFCRPRLLRYFIGLLRNSHQNFRQYDWKKVTRLR
jgi:hypothetical protein